jgi:hypothetical protein
MSSARQRRQQPETQIQRAVFAHLAARSLPNVFAFHPANGGWRSKIEAAVLKGLGVIPGVPDLIAIKDGRTFALELKAPGGRLTPAQRHAHEVLRAAGAEIGVAHSTDQAVAQLESWGPPCGGDCHDSEHRRDDGAGHDSR